MAHTNKTDYLNLPQWELSDKPDMSDYNTAFRSIDNETSSAHTAIEELQNSVSAANTALKTPLKELQLSVTDQFFTNETHQISYAPTPNGLVSLYGSAGTTTGLTASKSYLFTILPENARPERRIGIPMTGRSSGSYGATTSLVCEINPDGSVYVYTPSNLPSPIACVALAITFIAKQ